MPCFGRLYTFCSLITRVQKALHQDSTQVYHYKSEKSESLEILFLKLLHVFE